MVRVISLADGSVTGSVQLDLPIAAGLVRFGDALIGVGLDGNVVSLDLPAVLAAARESAEN